MANSEFREIGKCFSYVFPVCTQRVHANQTCFSHAQCFLTVSCCNSFSRAAFCVQTFSFSFPEKHLGNIASSPNSNRGHRKLRSKNKNYRVFQGFVPQTVWKRVFLPRVSHRKAQKQAPESNAPPVCSPKPLSRFIFLKKYYPTKLQYTIKSGSISDEHVMRKVARIARAVKKDTSRPRIATPAHYSPDFRVL